MTTTADSTTDSAAEGTGSVGNVFSAARVFDSMWNSRGKAVSPDLFEWQCRTWGSGNGNGEWLETAVFDIVIARFDLHWWADNEERDELTVAVPMGHYAAIAAVVERLVETEPESWPWFAQELDDHRDGRIAAAAAFLDCTVETLIINAPLLDALRIGAH